MARVIWCSIPVLIFGSGVVAIIIYGIHDMPQVDAINATFRQYGMPEDHFLKWSFIPLTCIASGFLLIWIARLADAIYRLRSKGD